MNVKEGILNKMKDLIMITFYSVHEKISLNNKFTFEIFGFDFMIDTNL